MEYTVSRKLNKPSLARFFEEVWDAEVSSDIETLHSIFREVCVNLDEDPTFEDYDDLERAQLFRCYGFFISHYGKAKNIHSYQERGKNALTRAINLFSQLDLTERALEAEIILGLCYFYEGAIAECEAVFEDISNQFKGNELHPLYLRTRLNSTLVLQWKGEFQKAFEILSEIEVPMEFCQDIRILIIYHTQAGLIYRGINQYDRAVYHYNKCIEISQQKNNWLVAGKNYNNLAFLYKNLGDFELAHRHIEHAIRIFRDLNHVGYLSHILDTKSVIYLKENKFAAALETIEKAIALFENSDDYAGLTDALWNKAQSLLGLERKAEAFETFAELCGIARTHIGQFAVARYSKLFAEVVIVKPNDSAIRAVSMQPASKTEIKKSLEEEVGRCETKKARQINKIELRETVIVFPDGKSSMPNATIETFYLSAEKMSESFGIAEDAVIVAASGRKLTIGEYFLAERGDGGEYLFGQLRHDASLSISYLLSGEEPFPLDEIRILGKAVGFRPFTEVDREILEFFPLPSKVN